MAPAAGHVGDDAGDIDRLVEDLVADQQRRDTEDALRRVYLEVLNGDLDPSDGHVLSLWEEQA